MTIFLTVFIPIAFLVSGQQFLEAARSNQERLVLDRIGMMHDVFSSFVRASSVDTLQIQNEIERLSKNNTDIIKMQIARDEGDDVRIIASLEEGEIGTLSKNPDTYRYSYANPEETFVIPYVHDGVRMWQSLHLVRVEGFPNHYIFLETSLEHLDQLLAERVRTAYYWLVGILVTILFLLVRHVRLIDYAYLYREAKKANETKDLFTNMIAHELRAPLTAIRGYASMIRERQGVDVATQHNAQEIELAAGRLVTIVSDLLDIARIQSGKMQIIKDEVHLSGLVRSVTEALHPSADEKHIQLKVEDVNGRIMVRSDEKRLFQVLTNVLSNAIKYTKEGSITFALSEAPDRVEIRVKDTGMGISASDQQKMFAPFFRVEGSDNATITGTGLGLWVTKQLVELMGGSIGVESIKGVGTHVVITLSK